MQLEQGRYGLLSMLYSMDAPRQLVVEMRREEFVAQDGEESRVEIHFCLYADGDCVPGHSVWMANEHGWLAGFDTQHAAAFPSSTSPDHLGGNPASSLGLGREAIMTALRQQCARLILECAQAGHCGVSAHPRHLKFNWTGAGYEEDPEGWIEGYFGDPPFDRG